MISDTIIKDIFDIEHKVTDVLIDHISDALTDRGFVVGDIDNYDTSVYISFSLPKLKVANLDGQLIIRRLDKAFEVAASLLFPDKPRDSITYAGLVANQFKEIDRYLSLLVQDCSQYVEARCIENNTYRWYGLNFKAPA